MWRQADKYRVPRLVFVNKMDRVGADFEQCVTQLKAKLHANPVVIQLPMGAEDKFEGVIDLLRQKAIVYRDETLGADYDVLEIPPAHAAAARARREQMIEALGEVDDVILEKYVHGEAITAEELKVGVFERQGTEELTAGEYRNRK